MSECQTKIGDLGAALREGKAEGKAEGKVEEAQRIVLGLGCERFGPPKRAIRAEMEKIVDLDRLERLAFRGLDAKSWTELIAES
jgi:hypothetical protein